MTASASGDLDFRHLRGKQVMVDCKFKFTGNVSFSDDGKTYLQLENIEGRYKHGLETIWIPVENVVVAEEVIDEPV